MVSIYKKIMMGRFFANLDKGEVSLASIMSNQMIHESVVYKKMNNYPLKGVCHEIFDLQFLLFFS